MNRTEAFREIRTLATEAVSVLGRHRAALGGGCSLGTIDVWLRCRGVRVQPKSIYQTLPRLRQWETWVHGYRAEQEEIRRLLSAPDLTWLELTSDLSEWLRRATAQAQLSEIALGCEVADSIIARWRLGNFPEKYRTEAVRALAHLRHLDGWPVRREACTTGASAS